MIVILDYGMGNSGSILNMIRRVGGDAIISSDGGNIRDATGIILPGVGSFDNGVSRLRELGILEELEHKVLIEKVPFLGVCLGMQLLLSGSDEGQLPGLGWISGRAKKFDFGSFTEIPNFKRLKVPHMGWNVVIPEIEHKLLSGIDEELRFYFVHSYAVVCDSEVNVMARSNYGYGFVCAIRKDNILGVQFHPEKSHKFGMQVFRNFLELVDVKG